MTDNPADNSTDNCWAAAFRHFPITSCAFIALACVLYCVGATALLGGRGHEQDLARLIPWAWFLGYAFAAAMIVDVCPKGGPHIIWKIGLVIGLAVLARCLARPAFIPTLDGAEHITVPAVFLLLLVLSVLARIQGRPAGPWLRHTLAAGALAGCFVAAAVSASTVLGLPLFLLAAVAADSGPGNMVWDALVWVWGLSVPGVVCVGVLWFLGRLGAFSPDAVSPENRKEADEQISSFLAFFAPLFGILLLLYCLPGFFGDVSRGMPGLFHTPVWFGVGVLALVWLKTEVRRTDRLLIALTACLVLVALYAVFARIRQYGLTPGRSLAAAGALWLFLAHVSAFLGKDCRVALWIFVGLTVVFVWTPLGAVPMSVKSQQARLAAVPPVPENLDRLNDIIDFLERYKAPGAIVLPETGRGAAKGENKGYPAATLAAAVPYQSIASRILPVSGYDYMLLPLSSPSAGHTKNYEYGNIRICLSGKKDVEIYLDGVLQVSVDLVELLVADIPRETRQRRYDYTLDGEKRWLRVAGDVLDVAFYIRNAAITWQIDALAHRESEKKVPRFSCGMILIGLRQGVGATERAAATSARDAAVGPAERSADAAAAEPGEATAPAVVLIEARLPEKAICDRIVPVSGYDYMLMPMFGDINTPFVHENIRIEKVDPFGQPDRFGNDFAVYLDGEQQGVTDLFAMLAAGIPWETKQSKYAHTLGEDKRRLTVKTGKIALCVYMIEARIAWKFDPLAPKEHRWASRMDPVLFLSMRRQAPAPEKTAL